MGKYSICYFTTQIFSEEKCTFDREETRKVTSPTERVTEVSGLSKLLTVTDKVVTTITEYFWKFEVNYQLFAYQGNNPDDKSCNPDKELVKL